MMKHKTTARESETLIVSSLQADVFAAGACQPQSCQQVVPVVARAALAI